MYKYLTALLAFLLLGCSSSSKTAVKLSNKVETLIAQMTLEEKVGQMAQVTLDVITVGKSQYESNEPLQLDTALVRKALVQYKLGSILNTANNRARTREKWFQVIGSLQKIATEETRLGIPILYGIDAIHGVTYTAGATFFPQQIGQAATWNRELVRTGAKITAYETRASSIPWTFSPVLDMGRDPRFPRLWETFGEDVFLSSELGKEMVLGYEGGSTPVIDQEHVASCLKHFLGYSMPNSGKDRTPATISNIQLREIFLPPFEEAIKAGASSVMINSGIINGIPVHANRKILTALLKEELGFEGLVITDWKDIENLYTRDKIVSSSREAVKLAINAGIDMAMIPYDFDFCDHLIDLVQAGEVSVTRIDDAVRRILTLKEKLGLFEKPTTDPKDFPKFGSQEFADAAYKSAAESITLLKNKDNILPLNADAKVLVTGPNANSMRTLNGGWSYSWQGEKTEEFAADYNTILEAIEVRVKKENMQYVEGVSYDHAGKYWEEQDIDIKAAVAAADSVDYILLCLGENSYTEKPGDLHELSLSENQIALAKALAATGKPIILILNEGRPRIIREIVPQMEAILQTYLPGNYGADALADILFGQVNPSGKLPYTYPMYSNTLVTYDHTPSEEQNKMEGVYDYESDFAVQFPFGFGLSYSTFEYSRLELSNTALLPDDTLEVSVSVKNTSTRVGKEVVQLYVSDLYASITPKVKQLKAFRKISLEAGETKTVSFRIPMSSLKFLNAALEWVVEEGDFEMTINKLGAKFSLTAGKTFKKIPNTL